MVSRQLALKSLAKLSTAKISSPQTRCNKCSTGYTLLIGYIDGLITYLFFFFFFSAKQLLFYWLLKIHQFLTCKFCHRQPDLLSNILRTLALVS